MQDKRTSYCNLSITKSYFPRLQLSIWIQNIW